MKHLSHIAVVLLFVFVSINVNGQGIPRFQKHYVLDGETATSIAKKFEVPFKDFCLLNDFPETVKLTPGQQVLIKQLKSGEEEVVEAVPLPTRKEKAKPVLQKEEEPVAAAEPVKSEPVRTAPKKAAPTEEPVAAPPVASTKAVEIGPNGTRYNVTKEEYHVVQKGQTFYRIALIYGLTVDELKAINGLDNTTIEIGQRLKVRK